MQRRLLRAGCLADTWGAGDPPPGLAPPLWLGLFPLASTPATPNFYHRNLVLTVFLLYTNTPMLCAPLLSSPSLSAMSLSLIHVSLLLTVMQALLDEAV